MDNRLFIAIDANAIVHRAFHAYPPSLNTTDGLQVNAVYGFTAMLLNVLHIYDPKYVVCAFDTAKPTFRHTEFPDYKGTRKPTDQSLIAQFPLVEEVLEAFNIPIIKQEGFEADDILGTFSQWVKEGKWSEYGLQMKIVTGDRDLLQLIGDNVEVILPQGGFNTITSFDSEATLKKYGYTPEQVVDYKGMVGDASDNIPGVKGIGDKTAKDLLKKYGSMDEIYKHLNDLPGRSRTLLGEGIEQAEMSRGLATIKTDVHLGLDLESCVMRDFEKQRLLDIFKRFQFRSLITKIPDSINGDKGTEGDQLGMFGGDSPEVEFNESFSIKPIKAVFGYISAEESEDGESYILGKGVDKSGDSEVILPKSFTRPSNCETWIYNPEGLSTITSLGEKEIGIDILGHYLSSGRKEQTLSILAFDYLSEVLPEKIGKRDFGKAIEVLWNLPEAMETSLRELKFSPYVEKWKKWLSERERSDSNLLPITAIDMPVVRILRKMEERGVAVDYEYLEDLGDRMGKDLEKIEMGIYEAVGHEFNLNSPKQLSEVLYDEIGLKNGVGGKNSRTTREDVLKSMESAHPAISLILEYRELSKIVGTYIKPFLEMTKEAHDDGRETAINTDFEILGSSSGRFSSKDPNMQNIPARGQYAEGVRKMFIPREGFKFVGADYSQIEFRVMADISEDPALMEDFEKERDIHASTAARILNKEQGKVSKEERSLGKTMNFAVLFGQTPFGLSRLLNIERSKATEYINEYFEEYKGVEKYIRDAERQAIDNGYVQSMFGRTRRVAGLSSRNANVRQAAVREAINMPIQGGEAEIMKLAMIDIDNLIEKKYPGEAFMLLQVHDELIFEVKEGSEKEVSEEITEVMKKVVPLKVPLNVHTSIGENLAELK